MCTASIDLYFLEHRKTNPIIYLAKLLYFFGGATFLVAKLVAGKTQNHQPLILVLLVQFFQAFILWGQSACTCGVHDQNGLAFEFLHGDFFTVQTIGLKIIKDAFILIF